jgi:hypothetical protein
LADPVTGLTPGDPNAKPLSFGPAPTSPGFDVLDLLKGTPQDRLRQLRQHRDDMLALTVPFAAVSEASAARTAAANALKRLTAHPQEFGFNLKPDDPRVVAAQRTLDKATDEFHRVQTRQTERSAVFQLCSQGLAQVEAWLRDGRPSGTVLEAVEVEPPKLLKGEDVLSGIERLRRRCRELKSDLHRIASAPMPSSWAKERMRAQVEALTARGEPDVSLLTERGGNIVWPTTQVQVTIYNAQPGAVGYVEMPDVLAIEAWRNKEAIIKQLTALIDAESDDAAALTQSDRELRTAETTGDLLDIERQEASLVWLAQSQNLPVEHRADVSAQALLGVALVTAPAVNPSPGTSPGWSFTMAIPGAR